MTAASVASTDDPRQTGALYAVAIAGIASLITFGLTMASVPIAGLLGWKFGGSFRERGDRMISMTLLAVLGTDLLMATLMGVAFGSGFTGSRAGSQSGVFLSYFRDSVIMSPNGNGDGGNSVLSSGPPRE